MPPAMRRAILTKHDIHDLLSNRSQPVPDTSQEDRRLTVLAIYGWREFWSMGEGRGVPSFFLSVTSFPKHGHDLHVLMPGYPGSRRREDYHGVTLHRFRSAVDFMPEPGRSRLLHYARLLLTYVYWFVRALPAGLALARRIRPDALFGMGELGAPTASIVSRLRRLPCVTRFFGIALDIDDILRSPFKRLLRCREIAAMKAPSDYRIVHNDGSGGDELAAMLGVDASRVMFFLDGVSKDKFITARRDRSAVINLGVPDGNRVVLSVSRLHEQKRIDRLIRAAPAVLAERSDVTFLVVGEGDEQERLEALAIELGIGDSVIFAGAVSHDDLPTVYASSDLFVVVGDRTNASHPLYESMLSALPVVALDTGRTADFIQSNQTGVLLSPEDLSNLPRVILDLLTDEARARSLGDAARAWASEMFPTIEERQAMEVGVVERAVRDRSPQGN